ncbi:MAG: nitroreductase family protein [Pseudomonadota bacterium]|nr:nitroreductase family protein [Pseudomonadota bacterium]MDP1906239.1 nitroreductase family protein [Pseudomonadota bacterium]MDP2353963.1 nitroreductase family protein [Pseudomonadota bacterium]
MTDPVASTLAYHARTKHQLDRYAAGPGTLDWDAQPDAFRHWRDTHVTPLPREVMARHVLWPQLDQARPAHAFTPETLGSLLRLCAGITAWKQYGPSRWSLRAHPSSGNLHPTETWLIAAAVPGLENGLHHYQPRDHSLERRAWNDLTEPGVWLGYSSIPWREAWKYGERAFRYCQLDLGHVLAALAYAAALHGWHPRLLPLAPNQVAAGLGLDRAGDFADVEAEEGEVIVNLQADAAPPPNWNHWAGQPSRLDPKPMYAWPVIGEVAEASRGPLPETSPMANSAAKHVASSSTRHATETILLRRSAQAFDGKSVMPLEVFRRLLAALLPGGSPVWRLWPGVPRVHPVLMVHRVEGLKPGLYALPRAEIAGAALKQAMPEMFAWTPSDPELPLHLLLAAKAENTARTLSCHQDIASHSAVTFLFIAEFAAPIQANPAAWRHLHWEAGMLGHCLGLEAEAAGWRGTGIGCFFDDAVHEVLGLGDTQYQVVYHFAVGIPIDDPRLTTLPAYS